MADPGGSGPDVVAELHDINKIYGRGELEVRALDGLNLTVERGDYLAVMGASGSGKSTAMNILGCLDRPTSGSYRLNGTAVEQLDDDALADVCNVSGLCVSAVSSAATGHSDGQRDAPDDLRGSSTGGTSGAR